MSLRILSGPAEGVIIHHVPKTGGMWLRKAVAAAGQQFEILFGERFEDPRFPFIRKCIGSPIARHHYPTGRGIVIWREPADWYRSYWQFRENRQPTWGRAPLDGLRQPTPQGFQEAVEHHWPGFHSSLYADYMPFTTEIWQFTDLEERTAALLGIPRSELPPPANVS